MDPKTILLTGATGFIGSHLAEDLSLNNYRVIALIRNSSNLWRCKGFESDNLVYVYLNTPNLADEIQKYNPTALIHSAWGGVSMNARNDWNTQVENIVFSVQAYTLAHELGIKKIISLGSQAEYGNFNCRVNENAACDPVTAYGASKLATLEIFKSFCELYSINWFWFRLFSLYGTRENSEWLISSAVNNMYHNKPMDMTACEQRYDYLYIKDFTKAIIQVLKTESESGIFNLSSNSSIKLKELIEKIRMLVNPDAILNFGALPYRSNQVMQMEGDSTKFNKQFNFAIKSGFDANMKEVINYCIEKFKK